MRAAVRRRTGRVNAAMRALDGFSCVRRLWRGRARSGIRRDRPIAMSNPNSPSHRRSAPFATTAESVPAFARTLPGRIALVAAFTALMALTHAPAWPAVAAVLALTSLRPAHRRTLLALATLGVAVVAPPIDVDLLARLADARDAARWLAAWPAVVLATVGFGAAFTGAVRRRPKSPVGRRPVLALLALLTVLLVAASHPALGGLPWFLVNAFALGLGSYVWFFAYAATEARLRGAPSLTAQLGFWRPFWGFSNVPMGKGGAYLSRVEAKDDGALAACQIAGLQLMLVAAAAWLAMDAFGRSVYLPPEPGSFLSAWLPADGLPRVADVLDRQAAGAPFALATRWQSVIAEFVLSLLHMTAWGNGVVATCRMAGFHAAANTDRPLRSTSVAEFYNRFYFYFKEMLAAFFFYPAYLTFFRKKPRLRLFFATFAAAGFGNFLFHFYRDASRILVDGYGNALAGYHVYACYAAILGTAIGVSQLRHQGSRRRAPSGLRRIAATAFVLTFYCLLNVLDVPTLHPLPEYGRLLAGLFVP